MNLIEEYYWVEHPTHKELCWIEKYLIDRLKGIDYFVAYRESRVDCWKTQTNGTPLRHVTRTLITKERANQICKKWYTEWHKKTK